MARIEWQKGYATGIDVIDGQHKVIIDYINRLETPVKEQNRDEVSTILLGIYEYINIHFSYEEKLLEQSGYKFIESHIRGHRRFIERLESFRQRFDAGGCIGRELHNFLHRWLISHIAHEDQAYVPAVRSFAPQNEAALAYG